MKLAAAVALAAAAACGTPRLPPLPDSTQRADTLSQDDEAAFRAARALYDNGDPAGAAAAFERLFARAPGSVVIGMWLQDAQIAAGGRGAERAFIERWELGAERASTAAACVLAARASEGRAQALAWLERAELHDPRSPWIAYGRAYSAAAAADWSATRRWLASAFELDPGHPWARWLEAWLLARDGGSDEAAAALDRWLERFENDQRIDARRVAEARLDRAILEVQSDEPDAARERLEALHGTPVSAGRVAATAAAIAHALGEWDAALREARLAQKLDPGAILPLVQEALVFEVGRGDIERAEAAWERVLAATKDRGDLVALLERTRARARLERLRAASVKSEDER